MEYFYTPPERISPDSLTIAGDEFVHLTHVMRKSAGDEIVVVDGVGNAYQTQIVDVSKKEVRCAIRSHQPRLHESAVDVTLAVGILKNPARFDFLVEKATELGVNRIIPLSTERTIAKHAKPERWQKIALASMKQSGRCVLPVVHTLTTLPDFIQSSTSELKLIAHEKADARNSTKKEGSVALCIGPEGGFSDDEIALAEKNGFQQISLGVRRLRAETAGIVAASLFGTVVTSQ